jgi:hypothetical protein
MSAGSAPNNREDVVQDSREVRVGSHRSVMPRLRRVCLVAAVATATALAGTVPGNAAEPGGGAKPRAPGAGTPPAGTGINTAAAYANPACDKDAGPYGKLEFVNTNGYPDRGGSPVCVAVWKDGKDNGGATSPGVTKNAITVVVLVPNDQQLAAATAAFKATKNAVGTPGSGTIEDAHRDAVAAYDHVYETYGREIDLRFVTSSGDDEAAQRADAVSVKAEKPFAVIDSTPLGHPVFETVIAAGKILVFGNSASETYESTQKQAPYRWGQADNTAVAVNVAEFLGKQLTGKKASYAGDEAMHSQTRKLGLVYAQDGFDQGQFDAALAKNRVKFAPGATLTYPASGGVTGNPTVSQEQAPTLITKLKAAGVTSVVLMADQGLIGVMLKTATSQDYRPEWIITGFSYSDLTLFARGYDQDQWAHAFGISPLPVGFDIGAAPLQTPDLTLEPVQWYFGAGRGTTNATAMALGINWLMSGIMYAGPKLTPQTFEQGYFSIPAQGGAGEDDPNSSQYGYGRTAGVPYDEYLRGTQDFAMVWWDPDTPGRPRANGGPTPNGAYLWVNGGKRYSGRQWPTKLVKFFDESASQTWDEVPPPPPPQRVPCSGCPSDTGQGQPPSGT